MEWSKLDKHYALYVWLITAAHAGYPPPACTQDAQAPFGAGKPRQACRRKDGRLRCGAILGFWRLLGAVREASYAGG